MKYVLVYIDSTDALNVVDGDEYDLGLLVPVNEACPTALPSGGITGAAVRLYEGQTTIEEASDIYPLPHFVSIDTPSTASLTGGYSQLRLSSVTNTPVPIGNNSASATVYYTFYEGWTVRLYNTTTSAWEDHVVSGQISASISGLTASTFYDVFVDSTETLTFVAWTGTSSRASALGDVDGIRVMDSDNSKLYIGKILIDSGGGTCTQTLKNLGVSNYYNRHEMPFGVYPSDNSWLYNSATIRAAGGSAANSVLMVTEPNSDIDAHLNTFTANPAGNVGVAGIGLNTTTAFSSPMRSSASTSYNMYLHVDYETIIGEGLNTLYMLERCSSAAGNVTFFGDAGVPDWFQVGLTGNVLI
jgi:hypothetical protein